MIGLFDLPNANFSSSNACLPVSSLQRRNRSRHLSTEEMLGKGRLYLNGPTAIEDVMRLLEKPSTKKTRLHITSVQFKPFSIPQHQTPILARFLNFLTHCNNINTLILQGCWIDDITTQTLIQLLPKLTKITTLNLKDNKIGAPGATLIARVLPQCPTLTNLDISCNKIGNRGTASIAEALPNCPGIASINLTYTDTSNLGVKALAMVLPQCPHIEEIILQHNDIFDEAINLLLDSLKRCLDHNPLSHLTLIDAQIIDLDKISKLSSSMMAKVIQINKNYPVDFLISTMTDYTEMQRKQLPLIQELFHALPDVAESLTLPGFGQLAGVFNGTLTSDPSHLYFTHIRDTQEERQYQAEQRNKTHNLETGLTAFLTSLLVAHIPLLEEESDLSDIDLLSYLIQHNMAWTVGHFDPENPTQVKPAVVIRYLPIAYVEPRDPAAMPDPFYKEPPSK